LELGAGACTLAACIEFCRGAAVCFSAAWSTDLIQFLSAARIIPKPMTELLRL
jgi:hypothetical protein